MFLYPINRTIHPKLFGTTDTIFEIVLHWLNLKAQISQTYHISPQQRQDKSKSDYMIREV